MIQARQEAASRYDALLAKRNETSLWTVEPPLRTAASDHLFHQYCVLLPKDTDRDALQSALREAGVASMVYYPTPFLPSLPSTASGGWWTEARLSRTTSQTEFWPCPCTPSLRQPSRLR